MIFFVAAVTVAALDLGAAAPDAELAADAVLAEAIASMQGEPAPPDDLVTTAKGAADDRRGRHRRDLAERTGTTASARKHDTRAWPQDWRTAFTLPPRGAVPLPSPQGVGGQIAADTVAPDENGEPDGAVAPGSAPAGDGEAPQAHAAGSDGEASAKGADTPPLALSLAKTRTGPLADAEPVATPVPPSLLLFASGIGLLGLSRRRIGTA